MGVKCEDACLPKTQDPRPNLLLNITSAFGRSQNTIDGYNLIESEGEPTFKYSEFLLIFCEYIGDYSLDFEIRTGVTGRPEFKFTQSSQGRPGEQMIMEVTVYRRVRTFR